MLMKLVTILSVRISISWKFIAVSTGKKVKCEYSGSFSNSSTVIISVDMATAEKQYLMKAKNITSGQINDLGIIFLDEGKFEDAQE